MSKPRILPMLISAVIGGAAVYFYTMFNPSDLSKLETAMRMIESNYVEPVDRTKLLDGAIEGMLESLGDPYTTYMDQEEAAAFQTQISSSFEGIGATMEEIDGRIIVVAPIKGSPAEAAGIRPGDQVIKVGDKDLTGISVNEAVLLIRGKKGTTADLTILRNGKEMKVSIVRDTIPIQTVYTEMKEDNIGVIRIASFSETTADEYVEAVKELLGQGMKGLILDLRQNPGGLTSTAEEVAETIVPDGKAIVQFKTRGAKPEITYSKHRDIGLDILPKAVLIDGGSASASEIVAGALQQSGGVPLIGETSFGKGTAQLNQMFRDGSSMKYTIAEWLTPNGSSINKQGLKPDIEVSLPEYASLPLIPDDVAMAENHFSDEIKTAQQMLAAIGFDPGRTDGYFDGATKQAVVRFQRSKKLEETGFIQGETTRALIQEVRELIQQNDTQLNKAIETIKEQLQ